MQQLERSPRAAIKTQHNPKKRERERERERITGTAKRTQESTGQILDNLTIEINNNSKGLQSVH